MELSEKVTFGLGLEGVIGKGRWLEENSNEFSFGQVDFDIPLNHPRGEFERTVVQVSV